MNDITLILDLDTAREAVLALRYWGRAVRDNGGRLASKAADVLADAVRVEQQARDAEADAEARALAIATRPVKVAGKITEGSGA